jgi:hypothetical protein
VTNEEFYDLEIAPTLVKLAEACRGRKMSFTASVEYGPDDVAETAWVDVNASLKFKIAAWGARCAGNVDSLMIAIQRHAIRHGHSSLVLKNLGVALEPGHEHVRD